MITRIIHLQSKTYWVGIALLLLSLIAFCLVSNGTMQQDNGVFIINYVLAALYFIILLFNKKRISPATKIFHWIIFFTLLLISAWALNRDMTVFNASVTWLTVVQVLVCASLVLTAFNRFLPPSVNHICITVLGFGLPLFIYLSIYVFPLYFFSIFAAFALGISLHSFAPLLITIAVIVLVIKLIRQRKAYLYSFLAGMGLAVIITIIFCARWVATVNTINKEYRGVVANDNSDIPLWVQLAQHISQDAITKKVLKTGIVYVQPVWDRLDLFWRMPSGNFNEPKKHDPLISVATMFARLDIAEEDRVKILEASFDSRHEAQERLWSGENLLTEHVFTNVQIWPALQLAYLEKTITVRNNSRAKTWPQSEEAIYTFYLPEGSVVSSLSLWINGIEEKGILTTKEKATVAYKTIVGTEQRDPSVIHWQEGNRVTVRVFPVMAANTRMFKIGITSPLIKRNNEVFFQNVYFKGPSYADATETMRIKMDTAPGNISMPGFFSKKTPMQYEYDGSYVNYWQTSFPEPSIDQGVFAFQGNSYSLSRYKKQFENKLFDAFYLDVNNAWTRSEFDEIIELAKNKKLYVNDNGIQLLTDSNKNELFELLHTIKFSLFPVYDIAHPDKSLLITKGSIWSPDLSDLRNTIFSEKLNEFSKSGKKLYVTDIGDELSPYLKTLREYRIIEYEKASREQLKKELIEGVFPANDETENTIILKDSELMVNRAVGETKSTAPDHLFRLYAYNDIMRQIMQPEKDTIGNSNTIIKEAEAAHIVTPVSSLIVLETQQDYDRFNIHDSKEGLQNASHKKAGAVPEPHEWALIIIAALLVLYLNYSSRLKQVKC